ncbi:MAG: hypothetical protein AAF634_03985 [Bacteroidota bacterium]
MKKISYLGVLLVVVTLLACESDDNAPTSEICDVTAEVNDSRFASTDPSNYTIESARVNGDCLEVQLQSGGCDGAEWSARLYASNGVNESLPPQRSIIIALENTEPCDAIVSRTFTFELTPLAPSGEISVILRLEGWEEGGLLYEF